MDDVPESVFQQAECAHFFCIYGLGPAVRKAGQSHRFIHKGAAGKYLPEIRLELIARTCS
jgi:hypothetical protein